MTNLVAATWRGAERLLRRWGGGILIVNMLLATAFGVMLLDSRVIRPGRTLASPESPGSGIVVRSEVVHLWLPEALLCLAARDSEHRTREKTRGVASVPRKPRAGENLVCHHEPKLPGQRSRS